jgi:tetratricopeptide (TPR) repeat protein
VQKKFLFPIIVIAVLAAVYLVHLRTERQAALEYSVALDKGIALFEEKNYEEALTELEKIPPGATDDWRAPYYRGSAQLVLKQREAAAESLQEALDLDPGNSGTLYALGVVYYQLGKISLSKGYFAAVLEINPADQQAKGLFDIMARLEQNMEYDEDGKAVVPPPPTHSAGRDSDGP